MPTLDEVKERLGILAGGRELAKREEVTQLAKVLRDYESLEAVLRGKYDDLPCIAVATGKRLVIVAKGTGKAFVVEEVPYQNVKNVQSASSVSFGSITLRTADKSIAITDVPGDMVRAFLQTVRPNLSTAKDNPSTRGSQKAR